jgi:hypothetical protein
MFNERRMLAFDAIAEGAPFPTLRSSQGCSVQDAAEHVFLLKAIGWNEKAVLEIHEETGAAIAHPHLASGFDG